MGFVIFSLVRGEDTECQTNKTMNSVLKYFRNVYCVTTNHGNYQDTLLNEPRKYKQINVLACGLVSHA